MSTAPQRFRAGLLGGAAILLVLLGVLAMHGLGGHATGHGDVAGASSDRPAPTLLAAHDGHGPAVPVGPASTWAAQLVQPAPGDRATTWWGALCLAVLVGAVLLRRGTRPGLPVRVVPARPLARTRAPGRRDRDPPCLLALSVRRC